MGDAGGKFDDLDTAGDLAVRVGKDLAVVFRNDPGEVVVLARQELKELEEDARAAQRWGRGPAGKRLGGGLHGGIDLGAAGEGDPTHLRAGRGIAHVAAAHAIAGAALPTPAVAG